MVVIPTKELLFFFFITFSNLNQDVFNIMVEEDVSFSSQVVWQARDGLWRPFTYIASPGSRFWASICLIYSSCLQPLVFYVTFPSFPCWLLVACCWFLMCQSIPFLLEENLKHICHIRKLFFSTRIWTTCHQIVNHSEVNKIGNWVLLSSNLSM